MLATSVRVSPCRLREKRSSSLRVTRMTLPPASGVKTTSSPLSVFFVASLPSSTLQLGWQVRSSGPPLGPFTDTFAPSILTVTPAGTAIGCLPIRDIARLPPGTPRRAFPAGRLPHGAKHLAADALRLGPPVAHHAPVGADDADAQPAQHRADVGGADVAPAAGLADALDVADDPLALG